MNLLGFWLGYVSTVGLKMVGDETFPSRLLCGSSPRQLEVLMSQIGKSYGSFRAV
jgi:hypothetical protein